MIKMSMCLGYNADSVPAGDRREGKRLSVLNPVWAHGLEAPLERRVLLDVLAVLGPRGLSSSKYSVDPK